MTDSENGKQIAEEGTERVERAEREPLALPTNVIGLDAYRERSRNGGVKTLPPGAGGAEDGAWERTSQPLLPEDAESGRPAVHIVKVSSGFGKLRVPAPAWNGHIRCLAAA